MTPIQPRYAYACFFGIFVTQAQPHWGTYSSTRFGCVNGIFTSALQLSNFFLFSNFFLSFYDYSFPLLVSSSLFSRFICCYVLFFVSCLPMTHLHSHGAFSTRFHGTMSGRRHSIFAFFSL